VRSDGDLDLTGNIRQNGVKILHTLGSQSVAVGAGALTVNTGANNTASGYQALGSNTTGYYNTASGFNSLTANTLGYENVANGSGALYVNTSGHDNTAIGHTGLINNTTGAANTALGAYALSYNATGNYNIAIGYTAGYYLSTGDNNIIIGQTLASAGMANTTIIGDGTHQNRVFITGIRGIQTGNADAQTVVIDSAGQLGTINSSRRFKEDIQDLGDASSKLSQLRPVTYRYKQPYADGSKPLDYGLIAEEVAAVYPDLVAKDKDGQPQSVQYHKLIPMLLNELQKMQAEIKLLKNQPSSPKIAE
jgi:hypothetical protein